MPLAAQPNVRCDSRRAAYAVATAAVVLALWWPVRLIGSSAPTLADEELVKRAELIFLGVVTRVDYRMSTLRTSADAKWPHTFVTFQTEKILKGKHTGLSNLFTLRLTGGVDLNGRFLRLEGCPDFDIGERVVLFVRRNERAFCPVAGWGQGRFRIVDGALFSETAREVWLSPSPSRLLLGPRRDLTEERVHQRGGNVYTTRVRGPKNPEALATTPAMIGTRLSVAAFANYVASVVNRVHTSLELSSLPPVRSAAIDQPFYVSTLSDVGDPAPPK
jgi:hypothetical protein